MGVPKEHEQKNTNSKKQAKEVGFHVKYANNMQNEYWPERIKKGMSLMRACSKLA